MTRTSSPPRVLFLGVTYAGHSTRFANLKANLEGSGAIAPMYRAVTGWSPGGLIERFPLVPKSVRGRTRAVIEARAFAAMPRPDAIWLSSPEVVLPYLWAQVGRWRRPVVLDLDATRLQLDAMSEWYFGRAPRRGPRSLFQSANEALLRRAVDFYTPWSTWAADGLRAEGIPDDRIRVIPPGIDLEAWRPALRDSANADRPLRLLFVGGDFIRKGGDILVKVVRSLGGQVEADIVTRDAVEPAPHVRVNRAEANTPELKALYANADVFLLPSRAECFGIAAIEAMAAGLPVIMADVGGARDIVQPGVTGWLIQPEAPDLAAAVHAALNGRDSLATMGAAARLTAEQRFNGRTNDQLLAEVLVDLHEARTRGGRGNVQGLDLRAG